MFLWLVEDIGLAKKFARVFNITYYGKYDMMLKLQYFGHLMRRANSLEKTLMLGKTEGKRGREWQDEMVGWHH